MNRDWWRGKRVGITGSRRGFLASHLSSALLALGSNIEFIGLPATDLRYATVRISKTNAVDVLFHLAADVGGIGHNISRPAEILYNNVLLNTRVVDMCRFNVGKVIALGSSCAYPLDAPQPYVEPDYLRGEPEPTNAPYAYSKRLLLMHLQAAHAQYGLPFTYLILANLYGEGCETDPQKAHVIGSLTRGFYEAHRDNKDMVLWGNGESVRDFLHVDDAVDALLAAGERESSGEVFNVSSGEWRSIKQIAYSIAYLSGYIGRIEYDATKPLGSARRILNGLKISPWWSPRIPIERGLIRMVEWYAQAQLEKLAHA